MNQVQILAMLQLSLCFVCQHASTGQNLPSSNENYAEAASREKTGQNVRILFWNVENLFDYKDDTLTSDEEFTSSGAMYWSYSKLQTKIAHLAKSILAAGEWNAPSIIGMCEVENRYVLNKLVYHSPLQLFGYRVIHRDSPDSRGIDVAMIYRDDAFLPLSTEWITIRFPFDTTATTREILYVKGLLAGEDTIHIFVNHWPSRRGGEAASAPRRNYVASVLRAAVDSILLADTTSQIADAASQITNPKSRITYPFIIIMGDFNDEPENESLQMILKARLDTGDIKPNDLVNLMSLNHTSQGSHKFKEHWGFLDQFIVSGAFMDKQQLLQIDPTSAQVFSPHFLLEDELKYLDKKPKRTYLGPRYQGGFSDHLPVYLDIVLIGH